jgi:hypothetical protein
MDFMLRDPSQGLGVSGTSDAETSAAATGRFQLVAFKLNSRSAAMKMVLQSLNQLTRLLLQVAHPFRDFLTPRMSHQTSPDVLSLSGTRRRIPLRSAQPLSHSFINKRRSGRGSIMEGNKHICRI